MEVRVCNGMQNSDLLAAMPACRCGQTRLRKDDGRNCPQMQQGNEFVCWTAGNQRYLTSRFFHMSAISKAGTQCGREREALRDCLADRHWPIHGRRQMRQDGNSSKIFEASVDVAGRPPGVEAVFQCGSNVCMRCSAFAEQWKSRLLVCLRQNTALRIGAHRLPARPARLRPQASATT